MSFLQAAAPLRLKVEGFRKPLRLRPLRREGALETFAVEDEALEALRFAPAGVVREAGGKLTPVPEAAHHYAEALDAFEALGRKLQSVAPRAAIAVEAVVRTASGCFWLQAPAGRSLGSWLAAHPGPVAEAIVAAFARRLAEALRELHAAGIVHGDLSPHTVLVDDEGVRLTGFMVDRRPFFRTLRSQEGLVQPGYAPPEAHDGALRQPIGPAADIYAASALLQRLLTGRPPPAANLATRVAGDNAWAGQVPVSPGLRVGTEAGLAPVAAARPSSAAAWLAGLDLDPKSDGAAWFEGLVKAPPPEPLEPDTGTLSVPPLPMVDSAPVEAASGEAASREAPLTLAREAPSRRKLGWWAGAIGLAALAAGAAVVMAPELGQRLDTRRSAAPKPVAPVAPAGCQWLSAPDGWRLRCPDAPPQGLRLPERFDVETTARAAAGEPAAMERLGAFYRLRASETANPDRAAYAYQALGWLQRAAGAADDGRPDTARARDDAALALGQMLAHGEGGRAPDPAAAEARLRQAAAGSRADAVLALGQLLEAQAGGDPGRLAEARGLYARVAQLGDGSTLQREGERGLARIDAAAKPPPVAAEPPPAPSPPKPAKPAKPATKPAEPPIRKAPARSASAPKATGTRPLRDATKSAAKPSPRKPSPSIAAKTPRPAAPVAAPKRAPAPVLRTWTATAFVKVDPTRNFSPAVELAGRAACDSEGGETLSVRAGETLCPNGVDYCQVRAVATCQGTRP